MVQLTSRWGEQIDKKNVLPEYPRPNLVRDSYVSLNGEWEYAINRSDIVNEYQGKILVPFSPETKLSGVGKVVQPQDVLHYRKVFSLPQEFIKKRVILHFGAVDQECVVSVNGKIAGEHAGGYLAFAFDITDYLVQGENVLTLKVKDKTEQSPHARGKQKLVKKGKMSSLFYTPQSGIWKTVWLESVPEEYIQSIKITPLYDAGEIEITVTGNVRNDKNIEIRIRDKGETIVEAVGEINCKQRIKLKDFISWSPDNPYLYDVCIRFGEDEVQSYFGMRKFSVGKDKKGILRFYLNNKPYFFNGVLDQGYWPESLLTAPSDEALKYDILQLKEYGYNTIRKHIKIEPERFYYHCDKLGMLVWQDMPNGGGDYNMLFVTYLPNAFNWFARGIKDHFYGLFKRKDEQGRMQYMKDLEGMVGQLYNYPSIAVWVPFNEGWGQFDAAKATERIRNLDSTRLINEACGWFDQKGGDMYSIHNYLRKLKVKPQKDRVVALTEYGGYAFPIKNHMACEKEFGYRHYASKADLTAHYARLQKEEIFPNINNGLCSAIYTQTSDIEEEINGIMTYDRAEEKLIKEEVQKLNRELYIRFRESAEN